MKHVIWDDGVAEFTKEHFDYLKDRLANKGAGGAASAAPQSAFATKCEIEFVRSSYQSVINPVLDVMARQVALSPPRPIDIVPSPWLDEKAYIQVKFPKSKKARIRRKWRKDRRNWIIKTTSKMILMDGKIVCGDLAFDRIKERVALDITGLLSGPIVKTEPWV